MGDHSRRRASRFPKRPVARPGHEADLKKRTLTNLYNARPGLARARASGTRRRRRRRLWLERLQRGDARRGNPAPAAGLEPAALGCRLNRRCPAPRQVPCIKKRGQAPFCRIISGVSLNLHRPGLPILVRQPTPTTALRGFEMRTADALHALIGQRPRAIYERRLASPVRTERKLSVLRRLSGTICRWWNTHQYGFYTCI
jgi:hypothetical protein